MRPDEEKYHQIAALLEETPPVSAMVTLMANLMYEAFHAGMSGQEAHDFLTHFARQALKDPVLER